MSPRKRRTRHHLTPRCHYREGYIPVMQSPENILWLSSQHHTAWHTCFKEMSFEQVIRLLCRIRRMKGRMKCGQRWR